MLIRTGKRKIQSLKTQANVSCLNAGKLSWTLTKTENPKRRKMLDWRKVVLTVCGIFILVFIWALLVVHAVTVSEIEIQKFIEQ